jgi:hypothetical protein
MQYGGPLTRNRPTADAARWPADPRVGARATPIPARRHLIGIFGFTAASSPKETVLLEFFLNNLRFAAECKFTTEKTSAFFSILRTNHEEMVRGHMLLDQSLRFFKELLLLHAVQRPPYSVGIFSFKDVSLITDFVNSTCARAAAAAPARTPRYRPSLTLRCAPHPRAQVLHEL